MRERRLLLPDRQCLGRLACRAFATPASPQKEKSMEEKGPPAPAPATTPPGTTRPRHHWLGSIVAVVALALLAALAWYLTHPASAAGGAGGAASGPVGGPGGGPGGPGARGARGAPATTVGVAPVETADIPGWIDAPGTLPPSAMVTGRPPGSGRPRQGLFTQ